MLLYNLNENGSLKKVAKIGFSDSGVFLIDDYKTIYVWMGQKASKKKKDSAVKAAENLNKKRESPAKVQIQDQSKEYGAFLAIIDLLKKGIPQDQPVERRPELELEVEETKELIEAGLDPDLEAELTLGTDEIAKENKPYEELCKELAKLQLGVIKGKKKISEKELTEKTDEIYKSSSTYEELCWLIAEMRKLSEKKNA